MSAGWTLDDVDLARLDILAGRVALFLKAGDVVTLSLSLIHI